MGYRSEVEYTITCPNMKARLALLKLVDEHQNAIKEMSYIESEGRIFFSANDVKWYPDYEDVRWHTNLWEYFKELQETEEDSTIQGTFVRIGEDNTDIEEDYIGDWSGDLAVERHIRVDFNITDGVSLDGS